MLSKEVSSTIFKVFGMTRPGIEPWSPWLLAKTLPTRPMSRLLYLNVVWNYFKYPIKEIYFTIQSNCTLLNKLTLCHILLITYLIEFLGVSWISSLILSSHWLTYSLSLIVLSLWKEWNSFSNNVKWKISVQHNFIFFTLHCQTKKDREWFIYSEKNLEY